MNRPPNIPPRLWNDPLFRAKYAEAHGHHFTNSTDFTQGTSKAGPPRPDDRPGPRGAGPTLPNTQQRKSNLHGLSTIQVQRLLKAHGYKIVVDGKMGEQTKEAINAYTTGKPPSQWNAYYNRKFAPSPAASRGAGAVGGLAGHVGDPPKGGGGKGGGGKGGAGGLGNLGKLASSLLGGADVGSMIPASTADDIAGAQFDAAINDLQHQLDTTPNQTAQNVHDIQRNYGAVLDSQAAAQAADKAAGAAGVQSLGDAVKAIVSSLGGSANTGSAAVGAEGADAAGSLAANANAQDSYNALIRPLLQDEAAGAARSESARGAAQLADLHSQMRGLQQQRGSAAGAAMADILDKNNSLAQTRFGNKASLLNTIGSLEISGQNAQTSALNAAIRAAAANKPKTISPTQLSQIAKAALSQFQDANGGIDKTVTQKLGPQGITKAIKNQFLAAGLDLTNPQVAQAMFGVGRSLQSAGINYAPDPHWFYLG